MSTIGIDNPDPVKNGFEEKETIARSVTLAQRKIGCPFRFNKYLGIRL